MLVFWESPWEENGWVEILTSRSDRVGQKSRGAAGMAGRVRSVILSRKHEDRDIKVSDRNSGRTAMWPPWEEGREVKSGKRSNRGWCSGEEGPSDSRSPRDPCPVTFASYGVQRSRSGHFKYILIEPRLRRKERKREREKIAPWKNTLLTAMLFLA